MSASLKPRQLTLDLALKPSFALDDFLVGPSNAAAFAMVERWPDWPAPLLLIIGPEGAGKSHLASIWANDAVAPLIYATSLGSLDLVHLIENRAVAVENVDRVGQNEHALFHLINLAREHRATLLMTARSHPDTWGVTTADLLSRLRLAPVVEIAPPDDDLLRSLIVKQFMDRQIMVDTGVIEYILPRMERSFSGAAQLVDALDQESLTLGKRVTRAMAAAVLERQSE